MNSDTPLTPREEAEIRLTALLMGELSPDEAAALRAQIAHDPELNALFTRLQRAFSVLKEATSLSAGSPESAEPARLSTEKRERLLRQLQSGTTVQPHAGTIRKPRRIIPWLLPL